MTDMVSIDEILAARLAGRANERRRLNRIFKHPAAARNDELASSLAFGTTKSADEVIQTLKAFGGLVRTAQ